MPSIHGILMEFRLKTIFSVCVLSSVLLTIGWTTEGQDLGPGDFVVFDAGWQSTQRDIQLAKRQRYLLYEVNHGEGFNLRRDVYMRVANLVQQLRQGQHDWILVLPPWGHLYHWKSKELGNQMNIPWSHFFDLESLNRFIPVMELAEFMKEYGEIDMVYWLQYFADTFNEGVTWEEKCQLSTCLSSSVHYRLEDHGTEKRVTGWFWGYEHMVAHNFSCLSLQGRAANLIPLLESNINHRAILLDRAEIVLHDTYGDATYWKARRSMRFAKHLRNIGDQFRRAHLNSTDETDGTTLMDDWTQDTQAVDGGRYARGGPYVAVHLRRQDFIHSRSEQVPSLENAANQIRDVLHHLNLTLVFVATDAPHTEFQELKSFIPSAIRYEPSAQEKSEIKDGGVAIVDQWICAHARYFIGTHESTFSFRVYEEREILHLDPDSTFHRFCGDQEEQCEAPSRWTIVY